MQKQSKNWPGVQYPLKGLRLKISRLCVQNIEEKTKGKFMQNNCSA